MNKPNGNQNLNKKYADFEIETYFNNESNTGLSAKDMQLKEELNVLTNQYMAAFNNINELENKFRRGDENIYKANMIKTSLYQIDFQNSNDYGNFLNQLYDITNNTEVTSITYDNYKKDSKDSDRKLLRIIADNKYDILLNLNKNSNQATYNKIKSLADEQKRRKGNNYNYSKSNTQDYGAPPGQGTNNYQNYNNNKNSYYYNNDSFNKFNGNYEKRKKRFYGENNYYKNKYHKETYY